MTVQSYNGNLDFGFVADRDLVPDLWILTDFLHEEMNELVAIAHAAMRPLEVAAEAAEAPSGQKSRTKNGQKNSANKPTSKKPTTKKSTARR